MRSASVVEPDRIVLVCNPGAGGRWRSLAGILDSAEARHVRRVVTDSIEDIGPAIEGLGQRTRLLCIYGGDGTIQKILTRLFQTRGTDVPAVALLGGGTMNVTSGWCGWSATPGDNFRRVVGDYLAGQLVTREVPLLEIRQGARTCYGFTWGAGTVIHLLDAYEHGPKGKLAALRMFAEAGSAGLTGHPARLRDSVEPVPGEVLVDGEPLAHERWIGMFCNTTGIVEIGVRPFNHRRTGGTFHMLAYAIGPRELLGYFPFLARGLTPRDPRSVMPGSLLESARLSFFGKPTLPADPRYVNRPARTFELRSPDRLFTIDGELFESTGEPLQVTLGPCVRLAIPA